MTNGLLLPLLSNDFEIEDEIATVDQERSGMGYIEPVPHGLHNVGYIEPGAKMANDGGG